MASEKKDSNTQRQNLTSASRLYKVALQILKNALQVVILVVAVVGDAVGSC